MNRASTQLNCVTSFTIDGCKRTAWHSPGVPAVRRFCAAGVEASSAVYRKGINEAKPATLGGLCFPTQMPLFPAASRLSPGEQPKYWIILRCYSCIVLRVPNNGIIFYVKMF